jgi:chemotaxis methyl-accepting protein methylase
MRARGVHTYADYARVLDTDPAEYDRLVDALTINVTKLFRNWDVYASMLKSVVPALFHREQPTIRVWSAGCSSGEEPYSLAVLFHRYASLNGMLAQIGRVQVLGTDIDRRCLTRAAAGQFEEGDFEIRRTICASGILRPRIRSRSRNRFARWCGSSRAICCDSRRRPGCTT